MGLSGNTIRFGMLNNNVWNKPVMRQDIPVYDENNPPYPAKPANPKIQDKVISQEQSAIEDYFNRFSK